MRRKKRRMRKRVILNNYVNSVDLGDLDKREEMKMEEKIEPKEEIKIEEKEEKTEEIKEESTKEEEKKEDNLEKE